MTTYRICKKRNHLLQSNFIFFFFLTHVEFQYKIAKDNDKEWKGA